MNTRQLLFVLGALIACLLLFSAITIVVVFRQRAEIESLRAQAAAPPANTQRFGEANQESELPPAMDTARVQARFAPDQEAASNQRDAFLQMNFTNFQFISFQPATNSETVIQRLKVNSHMVGTFKGRRYTGFRFTVPEWIDGDFEWMYFHLTNEANKNRRVRAEWYILPEHGAMKGFEEYNVRPLTTYPLLKRRFPNSREAFRQALSRERLKPGESYAIWFGYLDASAVPDIAVALTIHSERGHKEFGERPLK